MSSLPQKLTADLKSVKSLLEKHNPREAYEIQSDPLTKDTILNYFVSFLH